MSREIGVEDFIFAVMGFLLWAVSLIVTWLLLLDALVKHMPPLLAIPVSLALLVAVFAGSYAMGVGDGI